MELDFDFDSVFFWGSRLLSIGYGDTWVGVGASGFKAGDELVTDSVTNPFLRRD